MYVAAATNACVCAGKAAKQPNIKGFPKEAFLNIKLLCFA